MFKKLKYFNGIDQISLSQLVFVNYNNIYKRYSYDQRFELESLIKEHSNRKERT